MEKERYGVHITHCCYLHGCKYGYDDCPVSTGEVKQEYVCEYCSDEGYKEVKEITSLIGKKMIDKEELESLIERYKEELRHIKEDFQPCPECCDLTALRTTEYELERFIKDLKYLI